MSFILCVSVFRANLLAKKGFNFIAIEGDWPDAARIDHYVAHFEYPPSEWTAFATISSLDVA